MEEQEDSKGGTHMRCLTTIALALLLSAPVSAVDDPLTPEMMRHTRSVCDTYGVDMSLALAVMRVESGFDADAVNYDGTCAGLMQIHTGNAKWLQRDADADIYTPEGNITAGIYILSQGLARYGDMHRAVIAYNCGDSRARELWDSGTRSTAYSRKVLAAVEEYEVYDETLPRLRRPWTGGLLQ